ncbi:hypothetical protein XAP7430_100004 [Xanthomonas phaseoli pv. phaseoli]|uniref:Uncharacterized protein n=1 Tax=Xanthomonas campestris pv. phaseoli TaxID=317013 RepID=A0AB38DTY1_XANCH|nr:hypothetical protein XAP7430_100004 [Xanthomonas phaseoli pv. phaseoli]
MIIDLQSTRKNKIIALENFLDFPVKINITFSISVNKSYAFCR